MRLRQVAVRLIGLGLFALILVKLDLKVAARALADVHWSYMLVALAANVPLFGLKSWRWRELLRMQGIVYAWREALLAFVAGLFLGLVTPGRVGEVSKAVYLRQDLGLPISEGVANVLMDRLFDLYTILILGAAGLGWFQVLPGWALTLVLVGTLVTLALPAALLSKPLAAWVLWSARQLSFLRHYDARLTEGVRSFQRGLRPLLQSKLAVPLGLTLLAYGLFFGQGHLVAAALDLPIDIGYLTMSLSVAGVITLLPVSFSGLGTRDLVLIALFAPLGITAERAVAFSALFFLTFYVGGGLIGALAWSIKPLKVRGQ